MIRISVGSAALATLVVAAQPAAAQATGGSVAAPGSANSAAVVNHNREQNAGYNKVVGAMDTAAPAPARKGDARPATAAEIAPGSTLRDSEGVTIGTVDSVDAEGAVVVSGESRVKVPLIAFGKDDAGLLLAITAARFKELMAKATSSAQ